MVQTWRGVVVRSRHGQQRLGKLGRWQSTTVWLLFLLFEFQGDHFSCVSGNLDMSGNSAEVGEKSGKRPKVRVKSGKGRGICVIREIWLWQLNKITYLYFIRTEIHFFHTWCSQRIWINNCAFVRHIACSFVWKSRRKVEGDFFLPGDR